MDIFLEIVASVYFWIVLIAILFLLALSEKLFPKFFKKDLEWLSKFDKKKQTFTHEENQIRLKVITIEISIALLIPAIFYLFLGLFDVFSQGFVELDINKLYAVMFGFISFTIYFIFIEKIQKFFLKNQYKIYKRLDSSAKDYGIIAKILFILNLIFALIFFTITLMLTKGCIKAEDLNNLLNLWKNLDILCIIS